MSFRVFTGVALMPELKLPASIWKRECFIITSSDVRDCWMFYIHKPFPVAETVLLPLACGLE